MKAIQHIKTLANIPLPLLVICFWLVWLILGLHGFSIGAWHSYIDNSPESEALLGRARPIRSDDWLMTIPHILGASRQTPAFPVLNESLGLGQNLLLLQNIPTCSMSTIFRPASWGFFLSPDFGLSWYWTFLSFGTFLSVYLLLHAFIRRDPYTPALLAGSVVFSPFNQFFGLNWSPVIGLSALAVYAGYRLLFSARPFFWSIVLGWAAGCYIQILYPPFLVPTGYMSLAILGALIIREYRENNKIMISWRLALATLCAATITSFSLLALVWNAGPEMKALMETGYPGKRLSTGGTLSPFVIFSNNAISFGALRSAAGAELWNRLGLNMSESASFIFFFPIIILAALLGKDRKAWLLIAPVAICLCVLLAYGFVGFPTWFSVASLFSMVPSQRIIIAAGLADIVLIAAYLARPCAIDKKRNCALSILWLGCCAIMSIYAFKFLALTPLSLVGIINIGVSCAVAGLGLLLIYKHQLFPLLFFIFSFCLTAGFNPLVRGGTGYIFNNPVSQAILKLTAEREHEARWVVYNDPILYELPVALGLRTFSGLQIHPNFLPWEKLDPAAHFKTAYDRYGSVYFSYRTNSDKLNITNPTQNQIEVTLSPTKLAANGIKADFIIYRGSPSQEIVDNDSFKIRYNLNDIFLIELTDKSH